VRWHRDIKTNVVAIGKLFQWSTDRFPEGEREKISRAARELIEREDVDAALAILIELRESFFGRK
jgi:hypothetical protein